MVTPIRHFRRPPERPFTRAERDRVTVWFGGLTARHERLIQAAFEGLGYRVGVVPMPTTADFQAGRTYGNPGQCNPTYFTVGALVNLLARMRDEDGMAVEHIVGDHVLVTAGACGPCRFGMYEAEYRLALRGSGFDGFRVLTFQQGGGLSQGPSEAGIDFGPAFFLGMLNAMVMGDLLNEVAYQVRPYEIVPGRTEAVLDRGVALCADSLRRHGERLARPGLLARALAWLTPVNEPEEAARLLDQLTGTTHVDALAACRQLVDEEVEVDFTRPRPLVKVTGEFWAQTTEGDGNFRMFRFLEDEGAEVLVEPVATWISYMLHQAGQRARERRGLRADGTAPAPWAIRERLAEAVRHRRRRLRFGLAGRLLTREYDRFRTALGGTTHPLASQPALARLARSYYDSRAGGGEGHLEVAKSIYATNRGLCHMVLSLKPFGCMPSTQSDGVHAAVVSHVRDLLFLSVETSGEGALHAHSRVQMTLGEARARCREEFEANVRSTGYSLEEIRRFVAGRRELRRPFQPRTPQPGVAGRAAGFVRDIGARMAAGR